MLDSGVLGLAVGLVLVYFLLSLLCSGINEVVEAGLRRRAKFLESGIVDLLGPALKKQLYEHPTIEALHPRKGKLKDPNERPTNEKQNSPSYIPSRAFSQAVVSMLTYPSVRLTEAIDVETTNLPVGSTLGFQEGYLLQLENEKMRVTNVGQDALTVDRGRAETSAQAHEKDKVVTRVAQDIPDAAAVLETLRASIDQLPSGRLRGALTGYLTAGGTSLELWRAQLEGWFDEKMDRVSGWYSRRTRLWLLLYAIVVVLVLNADTAMFAKALWQDATLRESVVAQAESFADSDTNEPCSDPDCVADQLNDVKSLGLPLGWPDYRIQEWGTGTEYADDDRVPHDGAEWLLKILGLALTAAALTMGAPFWFDILNKFGKFKSTGQATPSTDETKKPGPVGVVIDVGSSSRSTGSPG